MKTAFLDLDGTLLDSRARHTVVLNDVLLKCGVQECDLSGYLSYKAGGNRTIDYLRQILKLSDCIAEKADALWKSEIEREKYLKMDVWYEDGLPFLKKIKEKGYSTVIVSARKNLNYATKMIKTSPINYLIDDIFIVSPLHAYDEKLTVFRQNRDKVAICIGDTEVDYDAGNKAGITTFVLNRGFRNKEYWDKRKIQSYAQLYEIADMLE